MTVCDGQDASMPGLAKDKRTPQCGSERQLETGLSADIRKDVWGWDSSLDHASLYGGQVHRATLHRALKVEGSSEVLGCEHVGVTASLVCTPVPPTQHVSAPVTHGFERS